MASNNLGLSFCLSLKWLVGNISDFLGLVKLWNVKDFPINNSLEAISECWHWLFLFFVGAKLPLSPSDRLILSSSSSLKSRVFRESFGRVG